MLIYGYQGARSQKLGGCRETGAFFPALRSNIAYVTPRNVIRQSVSVEDEVLIVQETSKEVENAELVAGRSVGRVVLESPEELKSTWEHRLWVGSASALLLTTFGLGLSSAQSVSDYGAIGVGTVGAYLLADLGTGIYHWAVDNYGDGSTPVFGGQIAAFQGHHRRPWTITEREFCNNVHKVFAPATPVAAALCLGSYFFPGTWSIWSSTFLFLACMSQQFHAWSHMKRSELPLAVSMAQDAGLLISRKDHGAHHKAPFDGNYCIVSGIWNPILDMNGDENSFFRVLERFIHSTWRVEPRCWHDPVDDWAEEVRS
jgi:ubiquitin-conjugating enzyme E2 variant